MSSSREKRPRQDPVSCELCRTKKLKCNREHPCSNCQARGVTCTLGNAVLPAPRGTSHVDTELILSRLDRLEGLLLNNPNIHRKPPSAVHSPSASSNDPLPVKHSLSKTIYDEALRVEGQQLYQTATVDRSSLFRDTYRMVLRISPVRDILDNARQPLHDMYGSTMAPNHVFWLPPKHEAITLLNDFKNDVDFSHHVVYIPKAKEVLEEVYRKLENPREIEPCSIGLLFSIFGSTACYRGVQNKSRNLFVSDEEALEVCKLWIRHGCDALEISRRTGSGTLFDVQSAIALCFIVFNLEGFSMRSRALHSAALTVARDIGLHKVDSPEYKSRDGEEGTIPREIKRRLWWHVASTDWLLAISGGPQEGCYLVNPRHMYVQRPRNITDDDLEREGPHFYRPMSEPTQMSYFLQRIRSAELARDIADAWPLGTTDIEQVDYNQIVEVDAKFEDFFKDMPVFFRSDPESVRQSYHILKKFPAMVIQKTLINLSIHMRRCKLHQPFLVRGNSDERYRYSREACLRSAREVIEAKRRLDKEGGSFGKRQLPLNLFVVHHLFIAVVVLVMDLCFNRVPGEEDERREEVARACRTLESTRHQGALAKRFLRSLTDVLRKHKINLSQADAAVSTAENPSPPNGGPKPDPSPSAPANQQHLPPDQQSQQQIFQQQAQLHQQQQQNQQNQQLHGGGGMQIAVPSMVAPDFGSIRMLAPGLPQVGPPSSGESPDTSSGVSNGAGPFDFSPDAMMGGTDPNAVALNDAVVAAGLEIDGLWQSYVDQGAQIDAANWDSLFSALEEPAGMPPGWNGVSV